MFTRCSTSIRRVFSATQSGCLSKIRRSPQPSLESVEPPSAHSIKHHRRHKRPSLPQRPRWRATKREPLYRRLLYPTLAEIEPQIHEPAPFEARCLSHRNARGNRSPLNPVWSGHETNPPKSLKQLHRVAQPTKQRRLRIDPSRSTTESTQQEAWAAVALPRPSIIR
jgi:hypothetical protein